MDAAVLLFLWIVFLAIVCSHPEWFTPDNADKDNNMTDTSKLRFFSGSSITTEGFEPDVTWTPFVDLKDGRVGYRVEPLNGDDIQYIYFNPSSGGDEGKADVFVYAGVDNHPGGAFDYPLNFYTMPNDDDGDWEEGIETLKQAVKDALEGDSNDAEHNALVLVADLFRINYDAE